MIKLYILSFLAGLVATYGMPHFIKGITGEKFPIPFAGVRSATANAIWGWVSFVIAVLLLHFSHPWHHIYRAGGLFAIAALLMAMVLAQVRTTHVTKR